MEVPIDIFCIRIIHPLGDDFPSQAARERFEDDQQLSNCHVSLKPTHARLYVHTALHFNGAASHLASPLNKQVKDGLTAAMDSAAVIPYFDDPFGILSVTYEYFAKKITEPPDCILQYIWMMSWHIFWANKS